LAPVLTAKNAAPSFTFSPFSIPFLVPSGNSAILSPFFNAFNVVFIADKSFESLLTYIPSNTTPRNAKNLFFRNSSFAKNLTCLFAVTTINGGSLYVLWFPQYINGSFLFFGMFSCPITFTLYITTKYSFIANLTIILIIWLNIM